MPQGVMKVKLRDKVPQIALNKKQKQKIANLKKGGRFIAPKNNKLLQKMKMRKGLETAINANIEQEMKMRAAQEGATFHILEQPPNTAPSTSKRKT